MSPRKEDQEKADQFLGKPNAEKPQEKPVENKTDELAEKLFDGLLGTPPTPVKQEGFPRERRELASQLAESLIDDKVNTPDSLAAWLDNKFQKKARKFSQALWSQLVSLDPELQAAPDWNAIYGGIDKGTQAEGGGSLADRMREIITADATRVEKARMMKRLADEQKVPLKEIQERIESELVKMVHEIAKDDISDLSKFEKALSIYEKQPLFSARTSTSVKNQAYSTPAPLAIALRHMTGVTSGTPIYEPTAGTGMLMVGANLSQSHANEIEDVRRSTLKDLGVATITGIDAKIYAPSEKFPVVHANPPFGSIDNVNYDGFGIRKLEHLISLKALEAMENNGTAALILGANMQPGPIAKGVQWVFENYLYGHYNVVDNFEVSGELYANQGAKWPVRIIIIAGRKTVPATGELAPNEVDRLDTWDDVWKRSNRTRNEVDRTRLRLDAEGSTGPSARDEKGEQTPARSGNVSPEVGGHARPTRPGSKSRPDRGRKSETSGESTGGRTNVDSSGPDGRPKDSARSDDEPGVNREQASRVEGDGQGNDFGELGTDARTGSTLDGEGNQPRILPGSVPVNERQSTYVPRADGTPFGTLTPTAVAAKELAALDKLQKKVGPLADYVADRINLSVEQLKEVLSADQIDGVAQAINQIETGGALVIGDETGIGKGRQAAAVIRYAIVQGKIPVFFTKDPKLFSDMFADLKDIKTVVKPLIFGDVAKASIKGSDDAVLVKAPNPAQQKTIIRKVSADGMENAGYDVIFSTYSQRKLTQ